MSRNELINVSPYVTPTRFSGYAGVFLARALIHAAPSRPSPRVGEALAAVKARAETARAVVRGRMRLSPLNLRPLDSVLDGAWVSLRESLGAKARLIGTETGKRCEELSRHLFPDGTSFVRSGYREQWAASQMILERIEEESLEPELARLVGGEFVPFIREAHRDFGEALGLGENVPPAPDPRALRQAIRDLASAIADYGRILAGELDRSDPESVAEFRRAMAPIDEHRRAVRRRARRDASAAEDDPNGVDAEPTEEEVVDLDESIPALEADSPAE